jgi:hypothetical protein
VSKTFLLGKVVSKRVMNKKGVRQDVDNILNNTLEDIVLFGNAETGLYCRWA